MAKIPDMVLEDLETPPVVSAYGTSLTAKSALGNDDMISIAFPRYSVASPITSLRWYAVIAAS
jgi:hypothetical protein